MTNLYKQEFPDFELLPHEEIPENWVDVSWHNDECPSWQPTYFEEDTVIFIGNAENGARMYSISSIAYNKDFFNWQDLLDYLDTSNKKGYFYSLFITIKEDEHDEN